MYQTNFEDCFQASLLNMNALYLWSKVSILPLTFQHTCIFKALLTTKKSVESIIKYVTESTLLTSDYFKNKQLFKQYYENSLIFSK